jgi:hypothetical protein
MFIDASPSWLAPEPAIYRGTALRWTAGSGPAMMNNRHRHESQVTAVTINPAAALLPFQAV